MNQFDLPDIDAEFGGGFNAQGYIPARPVNVYKAGVDLGRAVDSTAICILRKQQLPLDVIPNDAENNALSIDPRTMKQKLGPAKIFVELIQRLPLKISFREQAAMIRALSLTEPYCSAKTECICDRTGVGSGVVELIEDTGLYPTKVVITSGRNTGSDDDGSLTVPKGELMASLMAAFANRQLRISPALKDYKEFMKQMKAMQAGFSATGQMTYNGAAGVHDDYVAAAALALYRLNPPRLGSRVSVGDLSDFIS